MSACKSIRQRFHQIVKDETKEKLLVQAIELIKPSIMGPEGHKALVFCNLRSVVQPLVDDLLAKGFPVESFHGDKSQDDRDEVLKLFADPSSDVRLLVCTQILGRGHDFRNVRYVINFDMPNKVVEYIHRIGRTGRAGQQGYSLTFLQETDLMLARDLVMVLKESEQDVPPWLDRASRFRRKYESLRFAARDAAKGHGKGGREGKGENNRDRNPWGAGGKGGGANGKQAAAVAGPAAAATPADWGDAAGDAAAANGSVQWLGRGADRRRDFLKMCEGRGAARRWLAVPVP